MVCLSDSQNSAKAARHHGAHIVLVRNTSGQVQIFTKKKIENLNLANIARMIRLSELPKEKKATADWRKLGCGGKHADVNNWYYFKDAGMLFNGSYTHDVPATKMGMQALIEIIKYGLHPYYLERWCRQRGIVMNPEAVSDRKAVSEATEKELFAQTPG
jgi:hypothetical protein